MKQLPQPLEQKLAARQEQNALRKLPLANQLIDFASNDYLGFAKSEAIFTATHQYLVNHNCIINGATGSRLLSGNHTLYPTTETFVAAFHQAPSALLFNSGYDANVGFFSAVPQKGDYILYDELCHASIRDGIQLSHAKRYKFKHNDFEDLERLILKFQSPENQHSTTIYVVTESVFSMDGDCPNLEELVQVTTKHNCYLVIDEAHALGVFGEKGEGLVQFLGLQERFFARIVTFGKGLGCHGAVVLGSEALSSYLVNFARSFIYTTGLSPHSVATILNAYQELDAKAAAIGELKDRINFFNQEKSRFSLKPLFVRSKSAIQSAIIPGNSNVKAIAKQLQDKGFDVKPILSPTVPAGQERLRFCLHSYNTEAQISEILHCLSLLL
ncbi:8-amino-7-oxononanoate synthase [Flavobacterium sp. 9R]|uniref:aminotransferase class I/II-fold pyridoxal phosphate-dependent enzyme n=1 Tax=Flavobacterium sp. 9R TaxID=2653143 RepID=UPI00135B9B34|nr:8-amino-7-oxononanoate synthase [Flavobacterium sp. 9R]